MSPPEPIAFKRLTGANASQLKVLLRVFGEAFEDVETYGRAVPRDAYLARLLGMDHFIALVAMVGDDVVGGLTAYVLDKPERERREIYIYDLAVAAADRRRGVATGLIETLRSMAADLGACVVFVQADLEDAPAIALYEKLGTKITAHHFDFDAPGSRGSA